MSYTSWLQDPEGIAELASRQFLKLLFSAAPHTTTPQISLLLKELLIFFPEIQIKSTVQKEDAKRTQAYYSLTEFLLTVFEVLPI